MVASESGVNPGICNTAVLNKCIPAYQLTNTMEVGTGTKGEQSFQYLHEHITTTTTNIHVPAHAPHCPQGQQLASLECEYGPRTI
jgi:hypothetical protein